MTSDFDVIIVGGGAAGIGAARRLAAHGKAALVLEASSRLGGRAFTQNLAGYPLDLGCEQLHLGDRNAWVGIAEASGFPVNRGESPWAKAHAGIVQSEDDREAARGAIRHREFAMASGEMTPAAFQAFLRAMGEALTGVSRDGAVHFVCMDWRHAGDLIAALTPVYAELLNLCVWRKSNAGMGSLYRSQHELVFVYCHGRAPHRNAVELGRHGRNRTNVWDYPSVNGAHADRRRQLEWHPTVKPVALVAAAIKDVTRRGDVVIDSFLGSGTTLIACERAGRRCRGVEIDPLYVDLALRRWREATGLAPVLAATGQPFDAVAHERRSDGATEALTAPARGDAR